MTTAAPLPARIPDAEHARAAADAPPAPRPLADVARAMAPEIAAHLEAMTRDRRLPAPLAERLARAGFFRMMTPASVGGLERPVAECLDALEALGEIDASVGWCAMIAATTGLAASRMPLEAARAIHTGPEVVTGGVFAPMGRARADGDDYVLDGRWAWASGSTHCHWLGGGSVLIGDDGKPVLLEDGAPDLRMLFFPSGQATLIDTWHAMGLTGTGSGEMEVRGVRVPKAMAVSLFAPPRESGPLYRFPVFGLLALGIAAVMLGNARGAIDALVELAGGKTPQGSRRTLAERAGVQAELAQAEASLRAARALVHVEVGRAWNAACAGRELDAELRAGLRLAATHATRAAADVARSMHDLGGGTSVFLSCPLQRRFRDAHVGTQHMMVAPATWELAGRVLLGLPTDTRQV